MTCMCMCYVYVCVCWEVWMGVTNYTTENDIILYHRYSNQREWDSWAHTLGLTMKLTNKTYLV